MSEIQKFVNENLGCAIRVIDRGGEPWFVAKDVCDALGYANPRDAFLKHCKGGSKLRLPSASGEQEYSVIPESDLYRLIMRSQKPEAETFQDWVTEEVLPSIRKHGAYMTPTVAQQALDNPEIIRALAAQILQDERRIKHLEARDKIFGNRTPFGKISHETGLPRTLPVHGYLRSNKRGIEFVPDAIQLSLFEPNC